MANTIFSRLKRAWSVFSNRDPTPDAGGYYRRPDRPRFSSSNERSIVNSIFNRIALDCSSIEIRHIRVDEEGRYAETIDSPLNDCLNLSANLDQTGRAFRQDIYMSVLDEGCVAVVPVETGGDDSAPTDIYNLRTGKIVEWYPEHVKVEVYNERTGRRENVIVAKQKVAIIENPLYAVINEKNSTLQRLIRKINLLDYVDEQSSSGKLDLIIQLPYAIKSDGKRVQAEERRREIEEQLTGSKYGIAYIDGTEHITQLNRPIENNLLAQVKNLQEDLYSQLGITTGILDGTASEEEKMNYFSRTIEPIVANVTDEFHRKWLTKTARSQGQAIRYFRDLFKLVPVSKIAEIGDSMTRNEIMTSNEIRQIIGLKPATGQGADELRNKNLNGPVDGSGVQNGEMAPDSGMPPESGPGLDDALNDERDAVFNSVLDELQAKIDELTRKLEESGYDEGEADESDSDE